MNESKGAPPIEVQQKGGVVVIGKRADDRRLAELDRKPVRTQAELLEAIDLRLRRIEQHLGIE